MPRKPEIGNVQLYPDRPLRKGEKNGYQLKFYCPLIAKRIRKNCGTRDKREARRIQRECQERLLNGEYVASGGAITKAQEVFVQKPFYVREAEAAEASITWDEAMEQYRSYKRSRLRKQSYQSLWSRLDMARRIFEARRTKDGLEPGLTIRECMSLESLEYLQDQLLSGAEGRYEARLASTVNSTMGDVMAFVRYCYDHDWIVKIPPLKDLDEEEAMRGRPINGEQFDRLLAATQKVVGAGAAPSWKFLLQVLWESGFRIADALNFYWDDETKIHPRWPSRRREHPTIVIPSTQKNGKFDEIPMLPGLRKLLEEVPEEKRVGRVVKLQPIEYAIPGKSDTAFTPSPADLAKLIVDYSNRSIAAACNVSDQTVRKWLQKAGLERSAPVRCYGKPVPREVIEQLKKPRRRAGNRSVSLSKDRVSRIISAIGEEARIVVRQADPERGVRIKYASAHDLRRSLAERLYNQGISAETLMVIMRHRDFATTRKFYGAKRRAESAAAEIAAVLGKAEANSELVGGLVGGKEKAPRLTDEELLKLKALLNSL